MADMGYLPIGSVVVISFRADDHNGNTDLRTGFIPDVGQDNSVLIMPGMEDKITYDPLPAADQLRIHVELPMFGSGDLTVTINGEVKDKSPIESDTNWDYLLAEFDLATGILATNEEE
jgi:hypothetical protein